VLGTLVFSQLSLALSDKYRLLTEQLGSYSKGLEAKVAARTIELERANDSLRELAQRDPLTHLANRRLFDSTLSHEWDRLRREAEPLGLLLVDVDWVRVDLKLGDGPAMPTSGSNRAMRWPNHQPRQGP